MSLVETVLKFAAPLPKIEAFERYLFIGPHPDDIETGAGATAAKLVSMGKSVAFLICTDGRYGGRAYPPQELIELRKREAAASAALLGVTDVRFLPLCDGGFYTENELLAGMAKHIGDFKPDVIFAPDPDVTSECHIDHLNVGKAAKRLAYFAPYAEIMANYGAEAADVKALALYMTAKPTGFVDTSGFLEKQLSAIFGCHKSQFPGGDKGIELYLKLRAFDFGLRKLTKTAEGFRVLGVTQMHCLPEAGK